MQSTSSLSTQSTTPLCNFAQNIDAIQQKDENIKTSTVGQLAFSKSEDQNSRRPFIKSVKKLKKTKEMSVSTLKKMSPQSDRINEPLFLEHSSLNAPQLSLPAVHSPEELDGKPLLVLPAESLPKALFKESQAVLPNELLLPALPEEPKLALPVELNKKQWEKDLLGILQASKNELEKIPGFEDGENQKVAEISALKSWERQISEALNPFDKELPLKGNLQVEQMANMKELIPTENRVQPDIIDIDSEKRLPEALYEISKHKTFFPVEALFEALPERAYLTESVLAHTFPKNIFESERLSEALPKELQLDLPANHLPEAMLEEPQIALSAEDLFKALPEEPKFKVPDEFFALPVELNEKQWEKDLLGILQASKNELEKIPGFEDGENQKIAEISALKSWERQISEALNPFDKDLPLKGNLQVEQMANMKELIPKENGVQPDIIDIDRRAQAILDQLQAEIAALEQEIKALNEEIIGLIQREKNIRFQQEVDKTLPAYQSLIAAINQLVDSKKNLEIKVQALTNQQQMTLQQREGEKGAFHHDIHRLHSIVKSLRANKLSQNHSSERVSVSLQEQQLIQKIRELEAEKDKHIKAKNASHSRNYPIFLSNLSNELDALERAEVQIAQSLNSVMQLTTLEERYRIRSQVLANQIDILSKTQRAFTDKINYCEKEIQKYEKEVSDKAQESCNIQYACQQIQSQVTALINKRHNNLRGMLTGVQLYDRKLLSELKITYKCQRAACKYRFKDMVTKINTINKDALLDYQTIMDNYYKLNRTNRESRERSIRSIFLEHAGDLREATY